MPTQITGDEELKAKLRRLEDISRLYPTLLKAGVVLYNQMSVYPEQTDQKREGGPGSSWYIRGQGSKYKRVDGTITSYMNSEDLGQSWTMKGKPNPPKVIIGNDTSYGPWVKDPEKQADIMKKFNWTNTDEDVEKKEKAILREIQKEVDRLLAG